MSELINVLEVLSVDVEAYSETRGESLDLEQEAPCFGCPLAEECKTYELACAEFDFFVEEGRLWSEASYKAKWAYLRRMRFIVGAAYIPERHFDALAETPSKVLFLRLYKNPRTA
jgi:hypothetical protein